MLRYFVDEDRRMTRTTDFHDPHPPLPWREVSSEDYDEFRKVTAQMKPSVASKLHKRPRS